MKRDFTELIGNYVQYIKINQDRTLIRFEGHPGEFIFATWGDCCAGLEFQDIEYPAKKPEHGWRIDKVEEEKAYGYRLNTYEGDIVISCRGTGGDWGGYETGVDLVYYKSWPHFRQTPEWTEFKEMNYQIHHKDCTVGKTLTCNMDCVESYCPFCKKFRAKDEYCTLVYTETSTYCLTEKNYPARLVYRPPQDEIKK